MIKKQDGQSTIEFIITFTFGMSAILLIFNSAMNYTAGYLVHYATFMASRTYLTVDSETAGVGGSNSLAEQEARKTFARFNLSKFGIPNSSLQFNPQTSGMSSSEYLMVGTYAMFERQIDIMGRITGEQKVRMISESFLGKEVSRAICADRMCYAIQGSACPVAWDVTLFDDGC